MRHPAATRHGCFALLSVLPLVCAATTPAAGDVALLRNGRSLTVSDYRMDGDRVVLMMEGGGEIALLHDQIIAIRREPPAPQSDPGAPFLPPASRERASPSAPAAVMTSAEPRPEPGAPMQLIPGAVFDRGALRDLAGGIPRKYQVDESLVLAGLQLETRYAAFPVSPRGANGLMPLRPATRARFRLRHALQP